MQSPLMNEKGSAFAKALDEASGQSGSKDAAAKLAAIADGEADQDGTEPSAEQSLVAAMYAFPPQPLMQNAEQKAAEPMKAAAFQSDIQPAGLFAGQGQQTAGTNVQATLAAEAGAAQDGEMAGGILTDAQSKLAGGTQDAAGEKPVQPFSAALGAKQKQAETPAVNAAIGQGPGGKESEASGVGGAAGQAGEHGDSFRQALSGANTLGGAPAQKDEKANEAHAGATLTAAAIAQRAEHMQQAQDVQAAQGAAPEPTAREEHAALQVARATTAAIKRGVTEYKLRLRPEGLGQVEVTVSAKGSELTLSMKTDSEAAKGLILGHADELRTELRAQNYQINDLTVEVGMEGQGGGEFFASGQQAQQAFEYIRTTQDQPADDMQTMPNQRPQPAVPRNSTISYRV